MAREGSNIQLWIPGSNIAKEIGPNEMRAALAEYFAKVTPERIIGMVDLEALFTIVEVEKTQQENVFKATTKNGKTIELCVTVTPSEIPAKLNGDSIVISVFSKKEKMFVGGKEKTVFRFFPFDKPDVKQGASTEEVKKIGEQLENISNRYEKLRESVNKEKDDIFAIFKRLAANLATPADPADTKRLIQILSTKV